MIPCNTSSSHVDPIFQRLIQPLLGRKNVCLEDDSLVVYKKHSLVTILLMACGMFIGSAIWVAHFYYTSELWLLAVAALFLLIGVCIIYFGLRTRRNPKILCKISAEGILLNENAELLWKAKKILWKRQNAEEVVESEYTLIPWNVINHCKIHRSKNISTERSFVGDLTGSLSFSWSVSTKNLSIFNAQSDSLWCISSTIMPITPAELKAVLDPLIHYYNPAAKNPPVHGISAVVAQIKNKFNTWRGLQ